MINTNTNKNTNTGIVNTSNSTPPSYFITSTAGYINTNTNKNTNTGDCEH